MGNGRSRQKLPGEEPKQQAQQHFVITETFQLDYLGDCFKNYLIPRAGSEESAEENSQSVEPEGGANHGKDSYTTFGKA